MLHIQYDLLLIRTSAGFLSRYVSGPLPYVQCHIIVNKMGNASLSKTFSSFPVTCNLTCSVELCDSICSIQPWRNGVGVCSVELCDSIIMFNSTVT